MSACAMPGCLIEGEHAVAAHLPRPLRIHVVVTAADIAAGEKPRPGRYNALWAVPIERALARLSGQDVDIDGGSSDEPAVATLGQDAWSIVADLPPDATAWLDRRWEGESVEPFAFELEVPEWVVGFVWTQAT